MTEAKCVPEGRNYPSDEKAQLFNDMAPQSGASDAVSAAQPTQQFRLPVSDLHELSVLEYGNPKGIPAVFLHGGPGAGVSARQVASFDLDTYRVITFDQRGAGRSTPAAEIAENTTQHLIMDMETLREKLDIERWLVAGVLGILSCACLWPGIPAALPRLSAARHISRRAGRCRLVVLWLSGYFSRPLAEICRIRAGKRTQRSTYRLL